MSNVAMFFLLGLAASGMGVVSSRFVYGRKLWLSRNALLDAEKLIDDAIEILAAYLPPDSPQDAEQTINRLLGLLDGPDQRKVQAEIAMALPRGPYVPRGK